MDGPLFAAINAPVADALLASGLIGVPAGEIRLAFATAAGVLIHGAISGMNAQ